MGHNGGSRPKNFLRRLDKKVSDFLCTENGESDFIERDDLILLGNSPS
jgi:hypothetical protein